MGAVRLVELHSDLPGTLTHYKPLTCAHCIWPYEENLDAERSISADGEQKYGTTVTAKGIELAIELLGGSPLKLARECQAFGWEVRAFTSSTLQKQPPFASGQKEGQPRPDKNVTWVWVSASKGVAKFTATYENGRYKDAVCSDPVLGRFVAKAKMELDEWRRIF